ncbi:MAG: calcium:proton antiporter [Flavobacteriaceae bacterium]|jgi:Ca2+:H+ antiporter|nr:calcium:proton antiporter [Flavobacteriaceae bacterium]
MTTNLENSQTNVLKSVFDKSTVIRLLTVWSVILVAFTIGKELLNTFHSLTQAILVFSVLFATILVAAFGVVKQADKLAHQLGEPYGTLILTLSIVSIEVILIAAVLLGPGEFPTIGKDSIFSVMMIIMNLITGLCILLGALKYGEQEYNSPGTITYLSMIVLLGGISLVLPNYIIGSGNAVFSNTQSIFLSILITFIYVAFLFFQMKKYKYMYTQPSSGLLENRYKIESPISTTTETSNIVNRTELWIRTLVLILMILPIVLLSHNMAAVVDYGVRTFNLPPLLGGIIIAIIVFTPESITAIKAALNNEFQRAINLCHGAFVSTVGLTIPAVLTISLITGKTSFLALTSTELFLFITTIVLNILHFTGKRTTPILGLMHIVLFIVFILLIFNP